MRKSRSDEQKKHWENIYAHKAPDQLSWTQQVPATSLDFIHRFNLPKSAPVLDVGGGDSRLADYLLAEGYENITVLDISEHALKRAQARLGDKAARINWIVSDITCFQPPQQYDLWHDRATFHFLTSNKAIARYLDVARNAINGYMIIGTFSRQGPEKCSGLPIRQYDESSLGEMLQNGFCKIRCLTESHLTPFNSRQQFLFCSFERAKGRG